MKTINKNNTNIEGALLQVGINGAPCSRKKLSQQEIEHAKKINEETKNYLRKIQQARKVSKQSKLIFCQKIKNHQR